MGKYMTVRSKFDPEAEDNQILVSVTAMKVENGITTTYYAENSDIVLTEEEKKLFNIMGGPASTPFDKIMEDGEKFFEEVDENDE